MQLLSSSVSDSRCRGGEAGYASAARVEGEGKVEGEGILILATVTPTRVYLVVSM